MCLHRNKATAIQTFPQRFPPSHYCLISCFTRTYWEQAGDTSLKDLLARFSMATCAIRALIVALDAPNPNGPHSTDHSTERPAVDAVTRRITFSMFLALAFKALGQGHCCGVGVGSVQEYVASEQEGRRLNARLSVERVDSKNKCTQAEHPREKWGKKCFVSGRYGISKPPVYLSPVHLPHVHLLGPNDVRNCSSYCCLA